MHSSPNYDYVIHGDHIHWCNVEAHGMEVCQEWAMIDHMGEPGQNLATEAYYSIMLAMAITLMAGLMWGLEWRSQKSAGKMPCAAATSQALVADA
ncbi:hypothetical protein [Erythrobacter colymbi]|uniref:hypothetical protein n=1 Tax=Erythrobacter colymbi TaxID=1161202 RepID=UPI0013906125|nr:hypothetical protein [Erythrobacter colymbi]